MGFFTKNQITFATYLLFAAIAFTCTEVVLLKIYQFPSLVKFDRYFFKNIIGYPDYVDHIHAWFLGANDLRKMHMLAGAVFLFLAPFQHSKTFRAKSLDRHRWMGRVAVLCSASAAYGLYNMAKRPGYLFACTPVIDEEREEWPEFYDGTIDRDAIKVEDCVSKAEWYAVVIFGTHFAISLVTAMYHIYIAYYWGSKGDQKKRNAHVMLHKAWMVRHTANAVSPGVFRLINIALSPLTRGMFGMYGRRVMFGWQIFGTWAMDVIIAELYVRKHLQSGQKKKA